MHVYMLMLANGYMLVLFLKIPKYGINRSPRFFLYYHWEEDIY